MFQLRILRDVYHEACSLEAMHKRILIFILVLSTCDAGRYGCPTRAQIKPCICQEKSRGLDISCEKANAEQLREAMASIAQTKQGIWYLKFRNNRLVNLPSQILLGLDVRHFIALHCNLTSIDENAFTGIAARLETLDLAQNEFERIPSRAIENLSVLVSLNFNYNRLEILHAEAFKGLHSLLRLSLYGNRIKFIDNLAFVGIGWNLTRINLGANQLTAVPSRPLKNLSLLQRLQLHENQIEALLPEEFANMGGDSLDVLDLANNRVQILPTRAFMSLHLLNSLDLERNLITSIDIHAFEGIENSLEWLKLGVNRLEEIPSQSLKNLSRLRQLDLRGNNISRVKEDDFRPYGKNLKFIYLQNNWLINVDPTSLITLDSLEWLHLQSNQLNTFPYETYAPVLNTLQVFDIHDNPIHCDCKIAWLRDWIQNKGADIVQVPEETKCETPEEYQNLQLAEIPDDQLVCVSHGERLSTPYNSVIASVTLTLVFLMVT
ncbi:leucine-rich repeat-containing protein let-4 isoform X1 [Parasteatoda tepidariorum]|uniref:leucine-rich repeat-containing protein let-4 isoform X1 n=2 Tax=Parasteatoda tepidariorum TaxID=114398 RepID=UPI001C71808B|nr:slit homolog 1 protein isoform X1 [Parasteatoda tepidariorum]